MENMVRGLDSRDQWCVCVDGHQTQLSITITMINTQSQSLPLPPDRDWSRECAHTLTTCETRVFPRVPLYCMRARTRSTAHTHVVKCCRARKATVLCSAHEKVDPTNSLTILWIDRSLWRWRRHSGEIAWRRFWFSAVGGWQAKRRIGGRVAFASMGARKRVLGNVTATLVSAKQMQLSVL